MLGQEFGFLHHIQTLVILLPGLRSLLFRIKLSIGPAISAWDSIATGLAQNFHRTPSNLGLTSITITITLIHVAKAQKPFSTRFTYPTLAPSFFISKPSFWLFIVAERRKQQDNAPLQILSSVSQIRCIQFRIKTFLSPRNRRAPGLAPRVPLCGPLPRSWYFEVPPGPADERCTEVWWTSGRENLDLSHAQFARLVCPAHVRRALDPSRKVSVRPVLVRAAEAWGQAR